MAQNVTLDSGSIAAQTPDDVYEIQYWNHIADEWLTRARDVRLESAMSYAKYLTATDKYAHRVMRPDGGTYLYEPEE